MLKGISAGIALAIISVILVSCGSSASNTTTTVSSHPGVFVVTEKEKDTTVEVNKGDNIVVELAGNPTTGYQWRQIGADTAILQQVSDPEFEPDSTAIGSPGVVNIQYKAVGSGKMLLQLVYDRSFEPQTPPAQTFQINVSVN